MQTRQRTPQSNAELQLIARLKSCQKLVVDFSEEQFRGFYQALDQYVADKIRKASSNIEQNELHDIQRHFRHNLDDLQRHLCGALAEGFVKFKQGELNTHPATGDESNLSLLGNDELEEAIAVSSAARRADTRLVEPLWALNKRFSALIGNKPVTDASNPVAPIQFCEAFRKALQILSIDLKPRLVAVEVFERSFMAQLEQILATVNNYLIGEGILPNLSFHQQQAGPGAGGEFQTDFTPGFGETGVYDEGDYAAMDPEASQEHQSSLLKAIREIQNYGGVVTLDTQPSPVSYGPVPIQALSSFNGQFQTSPARYSGAAVGGAVGGRPMTVFSNQQLVGALQTMQDQIINIRQSATDILQPVNVAQVTEALTEELSKASKDGHVDADDMHIIELVGMLFDYMLSDDCLPDNIKALLSYLHTPYLKVAFLDAEFFEQSEHPARLLLNNLAEAGVRWVSNDGSSQFDIYDKIKATVSRVLEEFKDDVRLFAELLMDFSAYTKKVLRRQELMEKRAMEKVHGEEKLREVKIRVNNEIRKRTDGKELPSALLLLLLQPWSDYLAFILLRYGEKSDSWLRAIKVVDDVIWSVTPKASPDDRARQLEIQDELLDQLESGLETIGYDQAKGKKLIDAIAKVQRSAITKRNVEAAPPPMREKLEAMAAKKAGQSEVAAERISEEEARLVESLKMIEFGTWFEFEQGKRLKVAWYNSKTSHYMLVDQTGKKVGMKTGLELARDMLARKARVIIGSTKPFFERALENIFESMQSDSGKVSGGVH
ncbi:DUF1631 domain-containing protein [Halioxenophilus sp. WMMB6]|uniref:DUF1631 domain-containing protein n=1 Tax=Halioxenophilus sp. WMMB6 TaxID=3073815 RepID=UPI00295E9F33|nr:DUF1631 domain-containing protein [Halioxenophilus sp. WMMB6]